MIHISKLIHEEIASNITHKINNINENKNIGLSNICSSLILLLRGLLKYFLNINNIVNKEIKPAKILGINIYFIYSKKSILNDVAKYIFVGFPIINNILQVFAATNSPIKYGIGLTFVFLQKNIINGVKVITIMSLDVNMVKIDTIKYKIINNIV